METRTYDLSWLCAILCGLGYLGFIILAFRYRIRSAAKFAERFERARARGAFIGSNTPRERCRQRWLGVPALLGLFGTIISITLLAINIYVYPVLPMGVIWIGAGISIGTLLVVGLIMHFETERWLRRGE